MAVRIISTRLAISGEKEYQNAISLVNKQMATLKSELALTESKFKTSANSMEALSSKGEVLGNSYEKQQAKLKILKDALDNAKTAQEQYAQKAETLRSRLADAESQQEKLKNSTGDTTDEQKKLTEEITALNKELQNTESRQTVATKGAEEWQQKVNKASIELNDLDTEIQKNNLYLDEAKNNTNKCATSIDQYGNSVKEATQGSEKFGIKGSEAAAMLEQAFLALGVAKTIEEITEAMKACIEASIAFESAFAGVYKTVDGTDEQLHAISDGIKEMSLSIPATTDEIAKVSEVAGQLGINTKDVLSFTKVMINLGVSTNLTAEEAATMLAQFANITGLDPSKYENLGSAIVALGNNFATTEAKIVEMSQRMASAATVAGLSETDIVGFSTALSSLGIEAEAGGSAMARLISQMQSAVETGGAQLNGFAAVANMSATKFKDAWGKDAAGAIATFIKGLNDTERNGASATVVLDNMGITEVRLRNAILSLAKSGDLLTSALDMSNTAFEENNALQIEATKRYETTESKIKLFQNSVNLLEIAVGDVLNPALEDMAETGADVTDSITEFVEKHPDVVKMLTAIITGLAVLTAGIVAYTVVIKLAAAAQKAFNFVMGANPIYLVATAVTAAVAALGVLVLTMDDSTESVRDLTEASREAAKELETIKATYDETVTSTQAAYDVAQRYVARLQELEAQGLKTASAQREYKDVVALLNEVIPGLNLVLSEQTGLVEGGTTAVQANIQAWKDKAYQEAYQAKYKDIIAARANVELELAENEIKRAKVEEDLKDLEEKRASLIDKITDRTKELNDAAAKQSEELGYTVDAGIEWDAELQSLNKELDSINSGLSTQETNQSNLNTAIEKGNETLSQQDGAIAVSEEAIRNLTSATEASTAANDTFSGSTDNVSKEIAELHDAYLSAYDAAFKTINDQIGLFDELDGKADQSINDIIENFKNQEKYMDDYAANIKAAMKLGVDEGLIRKLSDGSEESARILAAIVEGGKTKVAELNTAFGGIEEGKENFADAVAEMEMEFNSKTDQMVTDTKEMTSEMDSYDEAYTAGQNTADGYINGVKNKKTDVAKIFNGIALAGLAAYKSGMNQRSPSKATMKDAEDTIQGYIIGTGNKTRDFETAMKAVAKSGRNSFSEEMENLKRTMDKSIPRDITVSINKQNGITQEGIAHLINSENIKASDKIDKLLVLLNEKLPLLAGQKIVLDTGVLVGETAPTMDVALGAIRTRKERGQ